MNKIKAGLALLIFFSIVSCKKDYVCECYGVAGYSATTGSTTIHTSKKKAEEICHNSATTAGSGTTCTLK